MDANEIMAKFQSIYGVDITQAPASFSYEKAIKTISEAYPLQANRKIVLQDRQYMKFLILD